MPRLDGRLPKYCLHKSTGNAYVLLNGRQFYLGRYGSKESRAEYDRLVAEWLAGGRISTPGKPAELRVADLAAEYVVWAESYYVKDGRPTDEIACIRSALRAVLARFAMLPISQFGPLALNDVRATMVDRGNSRRYVNKQIGRIRRMFRWGAERQLFPIEVFLSLQTLAGLKSGRTTAAERAPVQPVDDATVDATIEQMDAVTADMARFQRLTGCRPGEVRAICPGDITRQVDPWEYRPKSHKMQHAGRERVILIGPRGQEILRPYLLREASAPCFTRPNGKPYNRHHYAYAVRIAYARAFPPPAELEGKERQRWIDRNTWKPNQLRHAAATAIRQRFGLEAAQVVLGHATADVTQIYAERDLQVARQVAAAIG